MAGGKNKPQATAGGKKTKQRDAQQEVKAAPVVKASALPSDGSDDDEDEITELKVNEKFAQEYMQRKRKEELTKLERQRAYLEEEDEDESDSETEDEDAEELTAELDSDIKKTLRLIRNRDPIIYDKSVAFFKPKEGSDGDASSDDEDSDEKKKKKKKKDEKKNAPLYYKDLVRQQVIAGDVGSDDEDEGKPRVMTYGEEQAQLKQDFLKTLKKAENSDESENEANDSDLEGGLFSIRTKSDSEKKQEDEEYEEFQTKYGSKLKKDEIDPDAFLENYMNGGWKEKKNVVPHYEDIVKEDEEDAEELEKMEEFEHSYNFRFEEEGSGLIQTYARNIDDSMRRKDDTRKRKREERKERKALERLKKEEELKRLKNLKQAEIQTKLEKITKLVGKVSEEERLQQILSKDLEGDFDPEEYDKRMQQIFDDQYYNEDDDDMEKPTWDDEEDRELFAGLPDDEEDDEAEEKDAQEEDVVEDEKEVDDNDDDEEMEESAPIDKEGEDDDVEQGEEDFAKMIPEELKRAKQKYLDELYALDYEDLIGDIKCRFKYREVQKNDFGLTAEEIMAADDKELKQLVSLKRIAPYVEQEYAINRRKIKNFRRTLEEKQAEEAAKKKKKNKNKEEKTTESETPEGDAEDAAAKTKKRKRNKKNKQVAASTGDNAEEPTEEPAVERDNEEENGNEQSKKKKSRRGKKKKDAANPFASTGLSNSRLESYKLLKSKK